MRKNEKKNNKEQTKNKTNGSGDVCWITMDSNWFIMGYKWTRISEKNSKASCL